MNHPQDFLSSQWTSTVKSSREALEHLDHRSVATLSTWAHLERLLHDPKHRELVVLSLPARHLKTLIQERIAPLVPEDGVSTFIGIVRRSIELAAEEAAAIHKVTDVLRQIFLKLEFLNGLCEEASGLDLQIKEVCVDVGLEVLKLCTCIITFMRSDVDAKRLSSKSEDAWQPLLLVQGRANLLIDSSTSRLKALHKLGANGTRPVERADSMATLPIRSYGQVAGEEQAKLPCWIYPPNRMHRFFDRVESVEKMEKYFNPIDTQETFLSLALHGLGGVGKTSIALKYAETKIQKKELDALLWVHSAKPVSIQQSFTEIAVRLKLAGASYADHDENQTLVLEWLQVTTCRWLIVYDNAEDIDLLSRYWPATGRGQAIITTRNRTFAYHLADAGLEILTWDPAMGSQFLLHLLRTELGTNISTDLPMGDGGEQEGKEIASAYELAEKLSGHALAISHMAGLIHKREWTVADFMETYNAPGGQIYGISAIKAINALWDISFRSLTVESSTILGILSFLEPHNIPQDLFELTTSAALPEALSFCRTKHQFWNAVEVLQTLALVKRNKDSRAFTIHRLVQSSFRDFLTPSQRQDAFNNATILVSIVFPRRTAELAWLYNMWEKCEQYLPHVLSLKEHFRSQSLENPGWAALGTYCELNKSCQRYLVEVDGVEVLADLIEVSAMAMDTLPLEEKSFVMQGENASHTGQMYCRLGNIDKGIEWLQKSYTIFSSEVPFNATDSAWAACNLGTGYATAKDFTSAIEWYERARDHWLLYSSKEAETQGQWPATMKTSMGRAFLYLNKPEKAEECLHEAVQGLRSMVPFQWAALAEAYFAMGNLHSSQRNFEAAEEDFMEAQNAWLKGDQMRSAPFNGSCMYKLGCMSLMQGKIESAIKHLHDALLVTRMRSTTFIGEHARVMFKLSEALSQQQGEELQAEHYRQEAEQLLRQRRADAQEPGLGSTYDDLVSVLWR